MNIIYKKTMHRLSRYKKKFEKDIISIQKEKALVQTTKFIYKVHIQSPYIQSPSRVYCIYHISSPPSYVFFNVCMLRKIESGDFMYGMNDERYLHYLRSRRYPYYFLYCLDAYILYSFLQNRYYQYLNGHPNH